MKEVRGLLDLTFLGAAVMQDIGIIKQVTTFCQERYAYSTSITDEVCQYVLLIDSYQLMRKGVTTASFWGLIIELRIALRFVPDSQISFKTVEAPADRIQSEPLDD